MMTLCPHYTQHPNHTPPTTTDDGDYVTLVPNYKELSDAARGPLSLQRSDDAFGMVVLVSGNRFRVSE